ncbi:MAG: tetratricopeptide repeat protein [Pirellulaceae bacterium]
MSSQVTPSGVADAIRHQQAGELDAAREICREVLESDPQHPDALHVLGVVAMQAKNLNEAVRCLEQAVRLNPAKAPVWNHLGAACCAIERFEEGLDAFEKAISLDSMLADSHYNLGTALRQLGRPEEAVASLRRAVALSPQFPEALFNLGNLLRDQESHEEAVTFLRRAVVVRPGYKKARKNLAQLLQRQATRAQEDGDREAAHRCFGEVVELLEGFDAAHAQLGYALAALGEHEAAIDHYRQALVKNEELVEARINLGASLHHLGRFEECEEVGAEAIRLDPESAVAHYNLGEALLSQGKLEEGWREYEWRLRIKKEDVESPPPLTFPVWDGSSLEGKTILLQSEQGLGDSLQFVRYAPLLQQQGARVVVRCPKVLRPILATCSGIEEFVTKESPEATIDCQVSMLSVPHLLGTNLESIPGEVPYLRAAPSLVAYWRNRLDEHDGLKIGVVWRGSPKHKGDWLRSLPLEQFAPLAEIDGVQLVNLQKEDRLAELPEFARRYNVLDFSDELDVQPGPFMDTAAIIENLDLVICCDTSVGHLAGALGAEVWLALSAACDWRWMRERTDSPWYPRHRLFRQSRTGDWQSVVQAMAAVLRDRLRESQSPASQENTLAAGSASVREPVGSVDDVAALHERALVAFQSQDFSMAVGLLSQVVARNPSADAYNQLGAAQGAQRRFLEAEQSFEQAVALAPQSAEAHFNLGALQRRHKKYAAAAVTLRKAIRLQPEFMPPRVELGEVLQRLGRADEAMAALLSVQECKLSPEKRRKLTVVLRRLGDDLSRQQRHTEAETLLRRSDEVTPNAAETIARIGSALAAQGRHEEAVHEFERALAQRHQFPEVLVNLGASLKTLNRDDEAETMYRRAIAFRPDFAAAHCNLGSLLVGKQQFREALAHCRLAVEQKPDFAEGLMNLGAAQLSLGDVNGARSSYYAALRIRPDDAETCGNLGLLEQSEGNLNEALACYDRAIATRPDDARAHAARAMAWLSEGDFERGWPEYEWRFKCKDFGLQEPSWPRWKGEPLTGKAVLLWSEQGLGDTLQFVRYAADLKAKGARVLVECHPPLVPLLRSCPAIDTVVSRGEARPNFDVYAPLLSLPHVMGTTVDSIPAPILYLNADERVVERWHEELERDRRGRLRIGVCWRGHPKNKADAQRSFALEHFAAIAEVPGVELISLQKHVGVEELDALGDRFQVRRLPNLDEHAGPFMDTAAVLTHLDLVISCDSAVAHLAGAMGVRAWLALPFAAEWRWMRGRGDSPWYPRHRLYRQPSPGDWESVFQLMADDLLASNR